MNYLKMLLVFIFTVLYYIDLINQRNMRDSVLNV